MFQLRAKGVELFIFRDFLTAAHCAKLIASIDAIRSPSPVISDAPVPAYRTSETCHLDSADSAVAAVERELDQLTDINSIYGERLPGQHYGIGQQFAPHHDFFHTDQVCWRKQVLMGGQRTWTAMVLLKRTRGGRAGSVAKMAALPIWQI